MFIPALKVNPFSFAVVFTMETIRVQKAVDIFPQTAIFHKNRRLFQPLYQFSTIGTEKALCYKGFIYLVVCTRDSKTTVSTCLIHGNRSCFHRAIRPHYTMSARMAQCQAALPGTLDDSPYTSDVSPKSSKVGAFPPHPPQFCEKISVSRHQKSRKGTNPIRLNDANPSFLPIRRSTFVYTAPYPDVLSVQTCKNNHPSFVSKLGWLHGTSNGNRTHDFALRGQRLNRLTMEADGWGTRIRT